MSDCWLNVRVLFWALQIRDGSIVPRILFSRFWFGWHVLDSLARVYECDMKRGWNALNSRSNR